MAAVGIGILRIFMIMVKILLPGLHPELGANQNESAYGSVPDPFPSHLKMGKGRQRQTSLS